MVVAEVVGAAVLRWRTPVCLGVHDGMFGDVVSCPWAIFTLIVIPLLHFAFPWLHARLEVGCTFLVVSFSRCLRGSPLFMYPAMLLCSFFAIILNPLAIRDVTLFIFLNRLAVRRAFFCCLRFTFPTRPGMRGAVRGREPAAAKPFLCWPTIRDKLYMCDCSQQHGPVA